MATTLDVEIFKVINAGNFWAHPIASPGSEFQDFMGKLNDHFRQSTTSQAVTQIVKGQMCVIRRTSDSCWYRARVQNVLQTLSGPQASVFLVDLAESTLVPCCWIREVPAVFQNIPVQAMECFLIGLKPLGLVTSYFDLTTSKQVTDHWDEAATSLFKTLVQGRKLQVSIQKQDENGRYHVLLFADPGHAQICVNDELVINGFATCFSDETQTSDISPTKAAKLKAMSDKFQKDGAEMLKNLKEYVNHGKFTGSEESNSTDDELVGRRYLRSKESPLDILRQQVSGHNSYQEEHGLRCEPSARIPKGATQSFSSQRFSPEKPFVEGGSGGESGKDGYTFRKPAVLSSDENSGRVRFLSSRLPATGSGMGVGFPSIPSKSPDSANLKPILKKRSPHSTRQGSGSSSEQDDLFQRKRMQLDRDDSGVSCSEIPELSSNDTNGDSSLKEKKGKEPSASSNSISVDALFGHHRETSHSGLENADFVRKAKAIEPLAQGNTDEMSPQRILSLIESLRDASGKSFGSTSDSSATEAVRTCESLQVVNKSSDTVPSHRHSPLQSSASKGVEEFASRHSLLNSQLLPTSTTSPAKSPLPSEMVLSSRTSSSPLQSIGGTKFSFSDGVVIGTEGAPAPKPIARLEHCPFAHYLPRLGISRPSLIQAHAWPALLRGRDVVGICSVKEQHKNVGQMLAYLVPIIYQLVEERQLYADLPKSANGPQLLVLAPTWVTVVSIYKQCRYILERQRNIRVQPIFAAGAEENQVLPVVNGCEILIATPPCFLRMLKKGYITLDRLCHTVFHDADLMVEDFTSELKEVMRHYAKLLKSQPRRSAPRQAIVMASSWSVGVGSLVKAYLGNPVIIIPDMIEAAMYRGVQQVVAFCKESQRDVELLGYVESFTPTKDICIFASTAAEADNIGKLLNANCYFALVAHEFLAPQELDNVKRQWNTPHTTDAMPVLVMTDGAINQMNITNASCVIHVDFPGQKSQCGRRLTTLAGTFTSSKEHGCVSLIFVSDIKNMRHSPAIHQLVKRSGQDVPPMMEAMAIVATQEKEKPKNICHSLKAFGMCRYKRGTRICARRHTVSAELDKPAEGVPSSGIVKVLIMNVIDASCYWVRILEHRPTGDDQTSSRTADSTEFLELTMAVSGWYADPNHRVKHELVYVGDLCSVKLENSNSFHRVKVCQVYREDEYNREPMVLIHYVDRGVTECVHVDRLLQLPPQFHSCPFQAVEVFVCRMQPLDKDLKWTDETSEFVARLIEGKEMEGKVVLSLGNTMWLDPLVERKHLKSINVTTNVVNIRMELLKEKCATENKQHVRLLRNLCEGEIDLQPLEGAASSPGDTSEEQCPALETVVLPEDGFHSVYVSAVETPGLFFIQLRSSEESLEDLRQQINSGVNRVDLEESEITIGSLCVAQFSEDDMWYRARVLGSRPENEYDVFYVDFGDREWVTADRIVPGWRNILQLPLQAIECSLVNMDPVENEWSEESNDAFWEMANDQLLVAKVKSKSASLVAGCHRFVIELYNTTTEHDVIISHEMVATGHAQTSPEGTKMLFPYSSLSREQEEYDFSYQRIPDMCLQAHQCWDQVKKAEIVKEVQSIVLNSERSKDDIRDCGGIQALCRLLSLNRDPLVLQHILASLASLSFENESNCDEVRNQGGLQTMCYLLGKSEDSAVQESIAWALKNLAATERNQNEARIRGGIKALCELLRTASDDKVQERVTWAVGSLVKDHISNCQAVQECGGLKTLCDLVSQTHSENVLERTTWALGMLAIDLNNRNFIRQYGGIVNICKKLQETPSQQIVKQGALTLKTLASNNQFNKDVMSRLGLIGTLRSFMTDEPQRVGIIARRVCWDLLQRLLGSAAGNFQTSITPPAPAPVSRTQACSTSPGSVKTQEPEARLVNGVKDDNDNDDLPPLGGEDSDKENESAKSVNATPPATACAKVATRENVSQQVTRRNVSASARPTNHPRPSAAEEENVVPFSVHPRTVWSQTRELVRVNVKLRGVERQQTEITASRLRFRTQMGRSLYELDLELFEDIDSERSVVLVKGAEVQILLKKRNHAVWTRLLKSKDKLPYVSIDFDRWEVWSSSEEDEGEGADNAPNAQAAAPTNPNNSRRSSEDKGERRQVLLPEMIVSGSESDEESMASDVDCFNFHH